MTGGCARPIQGARVNRLRSNPTKWPIRGRELIKVCDLFKEIRYLQLALKFIHTGDCSSHHKQAKTHLPLPTLR